MIEKIKELIEEIEAFKPQSKEEVEAFRIKYLGKKGILNQYFAEFKNIPNSQKKEFGQAINHLKSAAQNKVAALKKELENNEDTQEELYGLIQTRRANTNWRQTPHFYCERIRLLIFF
jgi:phenylalanyl-tRNA synthetase alpha chain